MITITTQEVHDAAYQACRNAGFAPEVAETLAATTVEAELYGRPVVGLDHLPYYFNAAQHKLLNVTPQVNIEYLTSSMIRVDADDGPMQFAFAAAQEALVDACRTHGIGVLLISRAFAGGELGLLNRSLARQGLFSISTANSPAVMSVGGSNDRVVGTNPLSYGFPTDEEHAFIIDQASSATALATIEQHARDQKALPAGWALDGTGASTTDPTAALAGTLLPFGSYKGGNIALLVEFLSILGGSNSSLDAAPFYAGESPPGIGISIIAVDTAKLDHSQHRVNQLIHRFTNDYGSRLKVTELYPARTHVEVAEPAWLNITELAKTKTG